MMLQLCPSTAFILIAYFLTCVSAKHINYPIGVSLGHFHLSSAYYNAHNELIHVVTVNSSEEWRDYFWATWTDRKKHTPYYDPETMAMFTRTLEIIQSATESELQLPLEFRSITAPDHFALRSSMGTLMRAAYDLKYFASGQSYQVIPSYNAARLAYKLDSCKGYGLPAGCDLFNLDLFALVIEYEERYLSAKLLTISEYTCYPESERIFPDNGENRNGEHLRDSSSGVFESLSLSLQSFMDEAITNLVELNIEDPASKVHGIILTGEASSAGMEDMKRVIKQALPTYKERFLFHLEPGTLGAIGAAHRARQYVTENAVMNPRKPHEEL